MSEIKCINLSYVVSSDNAGDVENVFKKHASWMNYFMQVLKAKNHLISCYFTKAQEFVTTLQIQQRGLLEISSLQLMENLHR